MTWSVVGGSGFIGGAVLTSLRAAGETARPVAAPRVASSARTPGEIAAEADRHSDAVEALARELAGSTVVVNAAGAASPKSPASPELTGANALLPVLVARACAAAGVRRLVHLSSAAVQGHRPVLDESPETEPFSPYSRSKALGEESLALLSSGALEVVSVRATSVQGAARPTTAALARLAASPLASVASPGTAPSPLTSVDALAELVRQVGLHDGPMPAIVLQPWEGMTVRSVLEATGGTPLVLPAPLCRLILRAGYGVSALLRERLHGSIRRVELMWFGQDQIAGWTAEQRITLPARVSSILEQAGARRRGPRRAP
ncbi:NAD-dependent epimerase/dehydratase family protein [Arthrobacter sp. D2-10]